MTRIVVLISGNDKRTYPLADDMELQDSYVIAGRRWTVVAVLTSEDATAPNVVGEIQARLPESERAFIAHRLEERDPYNGHFEPLRQPHENLLHVPGLPKELWTIPPERGKKR